MLQLCPPSGPPARPLGLRPDPGQHHGLPAPVPGRLHGARSSHRGVSTCRPALPTRPGGLPVSPPAAGQCGGAGAEVSPAE